MPVYRPELTVTRAQVLERVARSRDWREAGSELQIAPGLAFMIATGVPADGSGTPGLKDRVGKGPALGSTQQFINHREHNPLEHPGVKKWAQERAASELTQTSEPAR